MGEAAGRASTADRFYKDPHLKGYGTRVIGLRSSD